MTSITICSGHLWRRWSLRSKYCIRSWVIFHYVASEYNSTFVFRELWLQLRILEMTDVHLRRKVYGFALIPCFSDHHSSVSDFRQLPCRYFLEITPLFIHCCCCIWFFHGLAHKNTFAQKDCSDSLNSVLSRIMIFMTFMKSFFDTLSRRFVGLNNASVFCLAPVLNAASLPVLLTMKSCKALQLAYTHSSWYPWIHHHLDQ